MRRNRRFTSANISSRLNGTLTSSSSSCSACSRVCSALIATFEALYLASVRTRLLNPKERRQGIAVPPISLSAGFIAEKIEASLSQAPCSA